MELTARRKPVVYPNPGEETAGRTNPLSSTTLTCFQRSTAHCSKGTRHWAVGFLVVLLCLVTVPLQAQFETASVLGFVHDSTGAAVANSQVTLTNAATGGTTTGPSQGPTEKAEVQ